MSKIRGISEDPSTMAQEEEGAKTVQKDRPAVKQDPNAIVISMRLAGALDSYLTSKPMSEVEQLVNALRKSRPISFPEELKS